MFFWIILVIALFGYLKYTSDTGDTSYKNIQEYNAQNSNTNKKPILDNTSKFRSSRPSQSRRITRSMTKSISQKMYDVRDSE